LNFSKRCATSGAAERSSEVRRGRAASAAGSPWAPLRLSVVRNRLVRVSSSQDAIPDSAAPIANGEGFTSSPFSKARIHRKVGEDSPSTEMELTVDNVDKVLEGVRPYLIADGGNVRVAGISNAVVMVELEGACGSCPSSTATMKMGIERSLMAAFGDKLKSVVEVKRQDTPADKEAIDAHLDMLRPAITTYGGSCEIVSVAGNTCRVKYTGPAPIRQGVQAAIKDKFPTITEVVFEE